MKDLLLTYPIKDLKKRGYTFQKLYARNHKTYRKEINGWTIWIWQAMGVVELNDYFSNTSLIVNYWKDNVEKFREVNKGRTRFSDSGPYEYMSLELDTEKEIIRPKNIEDWLKNYNEDYPWRELVLTTESFKAVIDEIDILTKTNL